MRSTPSSSAAWVWPGPGSSTVVSNQSGCLQPSRAGDREHAGLEVVDVADLGRVEDDRDPLASGAGEHRELVRDPGRVGHEHHPRRHGDGHAEAQAGDHVGEVVDAEEDAVGADRQAEQHPGADQEAAPHATVGEDDRQQDPDGREQAGPGGVTAGERVPGRSRRAARPTGAADDWKASLSSALPPMTSTPLTTIQAATRRSRRIPAKRGGREQERGDRPVGGRVAEPGGERRRVRRTRRRSRSPRRRPGRRGPAGPRAPAATRIARSAKIDRRDGDRPVVPGPASGLGPAQVERQRTHSLGRWQGRSSVGDRAASATRTVDRLAR